MVLLSTGLSVKGIKRRLALVAGLLLLPAGVARGVAADAPVLEAGVHTDAALTPTAAARARADVQIRRIKTIIVSRSAARGDQDAAFDQLERLRKSLRGEK